MGIPVQLQDAYKGKPYTLVVYSRFFIVTDASVDERSCGYNTDFISQYPKQVKRVYEFSSASFGGISVTEGQG